MKVILDTNVLVSGLLNPNGFPGIIIGLLLNGKIMVCYDSRIIFEYEKVLSYPRFHFDENDIIALIEYIKEQGSPVSAEPLKTRPVSPHDAMFLEVGLSSGAGYLITGNIRHYPHRINGLKVITPAQFIQEYFK